MLYGFPVWSTKCMEKDSSQIMAKIDLQDSAKAGKPIFQNLPKGCFDCDLAFWLILSSDDDDDSTHFYPPPYFSRDELLFFILYFDSPLFCFQQVDMHGGKG